jgi:hypothetical protein
MISLLQVGFDDADVLHGRSVEWRRGCLPSQLHEGGNEVWQGKLSYGREWAPFHGSS